MGFFEGVKKVTKKTGSSLKELVDPSDETIIKRRKKLRLKSQLAEEKLRLEKAKASRRKLREQNMGSKLDRFNSKFGADPFGGSTNAGFGSPKKKKSGKKKRKKSLVNDPDDFLNNLL